MTQDDKFTRPLGLSNDGKTMNIFPTMQQAREYMKKRKTVIVVDEDGKETEMPLPGSDEK
jgi:hypothetical protein